MAYIFEMVLGYTFLLMGSDMDLNRHGTIIWTANFEMAGTMTFSPLLML